MMKKGKWIIVLLACLALSGCAKEKGSAPDTVQRVLNAVLECPNAELYDPSGEMIPLDQSAPADPAAVVTAQEHERQAWEKAVGDCFAGEMFEHFWESNQRLWFLSRAAADDQTVSIRTIEYGDNQNGVQDIQVTILVKNPDGSEQEFELKWQAVYDSQEKEKLQTIELIADSGYVS